MYVLCLRHDAHLFCCRGVAELEKRLPEVETQLKASRNELVQINDSEASINERIRFAPYTSPPPSVELLSTSVCSCICRKARSKVEEVRSAMSASRSTNKVNDALMSLKRSGKIPGIIGRLVRTLYSNHLL